MAKIKGCVNPTCECNKKKVKYKDSDKYCVKCGHGLVHVCADCFTEIPADTKKYCIRCQAKRDDKKAKSKSTFGKVVTAAAVVATPIAVNGKKIVDKLLGTGK